MARHYVAALLSLLSSIVLVHSHPQNGAGSGPPNNAAAPQGVSQTGPVAGAPPGVPTEHFYPSPWGLGGETKGDGWDEAYERAREFVASLSLTEKVNLTTGTGWGSDLCIGMTGGVPRRGVRGLCLQDGPVGVRYSMSLFMSALCGVCRVCVVCTATSHHAVNSHSCRITSLANGTSRPGC